MQEEISGANKTQDWLNSITCSAIVISDEEEDKAASGAKVSVNDDELPDLDEQPLPPVSGKPRGTHSPINSALTCHLAYVHTVQGSQVTESIMGAGTYSVFCQATFVKCPYLEVCKFT